MQIDGVIEEVRRVVAVRADDAAGRVEFEVALRSIGRLEAWLAGSKAAIASKLSATVSFPEKTIAECTRGTTSDATKQTERADTLVAVPSFADALDNAATTAGHVDALSKAVKALDTDQQREELRERTADLVGVAAAATIAEWRRRLAMEVRNIQRDDGMDRFERQQRATSLRTWTDADGMWCLSGRFDPVTGVKLSAAIDATTNALFAEQTPARCPADPIDKQRHLAALALAALIDGRAPGRPSGRPEYIVVVDASQPNGAGGPSVDWGIPVEVPHRVLADLMVADGVVHTIVVRNGVVLHAPGELDLGRNTRLASPAQLRALRAFYSTCAIPGCSVRYDRCKLHHIVWWRNGGRTDLSNLLPVCARHHSNIHDNGWDITLDPNRELTIRFPDGTIHNTGPPNRQVA